MRVASIPNYAIGATRERCQPKPRQTSEAPTNTPRARVLLASSTRLYTLRTRRTIPGPAREGRTSPRLRGCPSRQVALTRTAAGPEWGSAPAPPTLGPISGGCASTSACPASRPGQEDPELPRERRRQGAAVGRRLRQLGVHGRGQGQGARPRGRRAHPAVRPAETHDGREQGGEQRARGRSSPAGGHARWREPERAFARGRWAARGGAGLPLQHICQATPRCLPEPTPTRATRTA